MPQQPTSIVAIASMTMMGLGTVEIAEKKAAQQGAPVYLYYFGYKSEMKIPGTDYAIGTPHAMDITFKFNNETPANEHGFLSGNNPDRFIASHKMAELWTTFARTGKPAAADVPEWPAYTLDARSALRIDTDMRGRQQPIQRRTCHVASHWQVGISRRSCSSPVLIYLIAAFALAPLAALVGEMPGAHPSVAFLFHPWAMPTPVDFAIMAGLGVVWAAWMYFLARAYSLAQASVAAPFEYLALPIDIMWGFLIWGEVPTWMTWAGALLTISSGVYVLYRERK